MVTDALSEIEIAHAIGSSAKNRVSARVLCLERKPAVQSQEAVARAEATGRCPRTLSNAVSTNCVRCSTLLACFAQQFSSARFIAHAEEEGANWFD